MSTISARRLLPLAFVALAALAACSGSDPKAPCVPSPEVCDGKDNDCNGQIDDGLGVIRCGQGSCEVTVAACVNGQPGVCTPGTPQPELCNGLDDDCDGVIDNGCDCVQGATQDCYSGPPGTLGVGACHAGTETCTAGAWGPCVGEVKPAAETCNGVDDDCNGQVDDGLPATTCGVGACARTIPSCASGAPTTCQPGTPTAEVCNGIDDDCDGQVDEGNPGGGSSCSTGKLGVCAAGTTSCQGGAIVCVQTVQPSAEICDGLDNDCDGQVDEGVGTTWYRDADGDGYGNPTISTQACTKPTGYVADASDCNDSNVAIHPGAVELCDGLDNNCDGQVDEGNPGGGSSCSTGKLGVCAAGTTACQGGTIVCVQNVQPSAEVCLDGLDNDCDGVVDNGCP